MKMNYYKNAMDKISADEYAVQKILSAARQGEKKRGKHALARAAVIIAAAALMLSGGVVYASEQELLPELVAGRWVVYAKPIPQEPVKGFTWVKWLGEKILPEDICLDSGEWFPGDGMFAIEAQSSENGGYLEKFAMSNGDVAVLCAADKKGFKMTAGQSAKIEVTPDNSAPYSDFDEGERAELGYFLDGTAYLLFGEEITVGGETVSFTAEKDGEYRFYIINFSAGTQNYREMRVTIS